MAKPAELDVAYLARLARIDLTEQEATLFQAQLEDILHYAEKIAGVDLSTVQETAHAVPVFNVFREDDPRDWLTVEQALQGAPVQARGLFIVPRVVE